MTEVNSAHRAIEILRESLYANIATTNGEVPWNTPATALPDADLRFYWSSWTKAEHSKNISGNGAAFLTFYDSTRARGTNNLRCLYLQCVAKEVVSASEADAAFRLLYPEEDVDLTSFLEGGVKRFFCAEPKKAWLNCLSEKELAPTTVKMRTEIVMDELRRLHCGADRRPST